MKHEPCRTEAEPPDADHPRAGWYVKLDEDGEETIFGPFVSEAHARHFRDCTQDQDHDH